MKPEVSVGPMPTYAVCAAAAALSVSKLNGEHPDKDFRVDCSPSSKIERRPGAALMDLCALARAAGHPFERPCV